MPSAAEILSPPVTESAAPLQTGASAQTIPTPAANSGAWYESFQDAELKTWAGNKKYENPEMAAKAAWSLERLLGADKAGRTVVLPKDDTDAEGLKAFRSKIGVPESPEGYKLPLPVGQTDDAFAKVAATWFHENGTPPKQAEAIVGKFNEYIGAEVQKQEQLEKAQSEAKLNDLKMEWAHHFDERSELGRRGLKTVAESIGFKDAELDGFLKKFESSMGTDVMLKMFWKMGEANKEGGFAGGNNPAQFGTTKTEAQEKFNAYQTQYLNGDINDHTWRTEYMNPGGKLDGLMKVITS